MKRVLALVEGQTEETFVRDVLGPHLLRLDVLLIPTLVSTKRVKVGSRFKGGVVSYGKVRSDLQRLLHDSNATLVTTMFDYYGLPHDFPGLATRPIGSPLARVQHVEQAMANDVQDPRFLGYLQLHEFEALLFSDPSVVAARVPGAAPAITLQTARSQVASPEEIDEGPDSSPSHRIVAVARAYDKVLHGPQIAAAIGLDQIRSACPHFDEWVTRLESA